jgi:hypothetical protein
LLDSIADIFTEPPEQPKQSFFKWRWRFRYLPELIYEWRPPDWALPDGLPPGHPIDEWFDERTYGSSDAFSEWESLPGNPWSGLVGDTLDYDSNELFYELEDQQRIEKLLDRVIPEPSLFAPVATRRFARQVAVNLEIADCSDDDHAQRVAEACDEIVHRGRFCYVGGRSTMVAIIDDETPTLRSIEAEIRQFGPTSWNDHVVTSESLGYGFTVGAWVSVDPNQPVWYRDTQAAAWLPPSAPPFRLIRETEENLEQLTVRALEELTEPPDSSEEPGSETQHQASLVVERDGGYRLHPDIVPFLERVGGEATRRAALLLEHAPTLRCELTPIDHWYREVPVRWVALDPSGEWVGLEQLSSAQQRWSRLGIVLALRTHGHQGQVLMLLDEPEAALHRRAERHLVSGLHQLADEMKATIIVATHSPAFFDGSPAQLVHVHRDALGRTALTAMPPDLRDRIDGLGLDTSDLLQLCRTVVLVEGEHELVLFDELFGSEFRDAGALTFAMRGVTKLSSAADAQLLFGYTSANLLVVVDTEEADRVTNIWNRACDAADEGDDPLKVLAEFTKKKRDTEQLALQEFCALAIRAGHRDRISFHTLSLADIPEYLPVDAVAPGSSAGVTWQQLHEEHERTGKEGKRPRFKDWMHSQYQADYSNDGLRRAARSLDHIHDDLVGLLHTVQQPN